MMEEFGGVDEDLVRVAGVPGLVLTAGGVLQSLKHLELTHCDLTDAHVRSLPFLFPSFVPSSFRPFVPCLLMSP